MHLQAVARKSFATLIACSTAHVYVFCKKFGEVGIKANNKVHHGRAPMMTRPVRFAVRVAV